jgi:hypothetical protein
MVRPWVGWFLMAYSCRSVNWHASQYQKDTVVPQVKVAACSRFEFTVPMGFKK